MADFARKHVSPYNAPTFNYDVSYVQTSRGDGRASYKVTVTAYMSTAYDYFGYYLDATVAIGNSSQTIRLKENSPTWQGTGRHSYTFNLNPTGLTNSSGTVSCYLRVKSNSGASGRYNDSGTISYDTVSLSSYNTAPKISGSVKYNVANNFNEKTSSITINGWSYSDAENNISKIKVHRWINGASNGSWEISPATTFTDTTVGNFGEGTKYEYGVQAKDSYGLTSSILWGSAIYKNRFTQATLAGGSTINYSTSSLAFTWSGASNTNGNTTFNYTLICDGVTIHRNTTTEAKLNVAIVDTAPSSGAYILRSDIISKLNKSNFNGTLTFTLTTTNSNGTQKSSTKSLNVDMRTAPKAPTSCVINKDKNVSTAIQMVNDVNYFIPDSGRVIKLEWNAGSDYLGGAVTYTVQRRFGAGSYVTIASDINRLYENVYIDKQTSKQTLSFKVITKTSYGYTSEKTSDTVTLHYYNAPSLWINNIERASTTAKVPIVISTSTSLWSEMTVQPVGDWYCSNGQQGVLDGSQIEQIIELTGLADNKSYTIDLSYGDNTGLSPRMDREITVGENTPVAFVNRYGLGLGGAKANDGYVLNIKGNTWSDGLFDANSILTHDLSANSMNVKVGATFGEYVSVDGTLDVAGNISTDSAIYANNSINIKAINNDNDGKVLSIQRKNGTNLAYIDMEANGEGISLHTYNKSGAWANNYQFMTNYFNANGGLRCGGQNVIEKGSNGNGEWTKFYDGTLICRRLYNYTKGNFSNVSGGWYFMSSDNWIFPHEFVDTPMVTLTMNDGGALRFGQTRGVTKSGFNSYVCASTQNNNAFGYFYIAIGRWK